jgi:uncharacterized membrane protein YhaH (DUF805 family)
MDNTIAGAAQGFNPLSATKKAFQNYVTFTGRARPSEYWYFVLGIVIVSIVLSVVESMIGLPGVLSGLWSLALLLPSIAVAVRRLHDGDRSGWWYLLSFTGIGVFVLIYWMIQKGDAAPNRFGAPPAFA